MESISVSIPNIILKHRSHVCPEVPVTTLSMIVTQMLHETDPQILNYVLTLFDKYANSSYDDCKGSDAKARRVAHFLKYMKQLKLHEIDYGFGISKTYRQSFLDEKYGYGGGQEVWIVGGHDTLVPLEVGVRLDSRLHGGRRTHLAEVRLRVQGLTQNLVRRLLLRMPQPHWRTQELAAVLAGMGLQLAGEPRVEVGLELRTRGAVVLHKVLTARDAEEGGELRQFLSSLAQEQSGNEFLLTWARAFDWGVQVSM